MHSIASRLETIIDQQLPVLRQIQPEELSFKPAPGKWSKKEILGHLVDSAQNNIRRFIMAQYEDNPHIVYAQEKWVLASGYQQWKDADIIDLWYLLNKQVVAILRNTPGPMYQRSCQTQELHTIEWLAEDYVKHLLHHLHVVLNLEPVAYP